jgi:hypothetical protein
MKPHDFGTLLAMVALLSLALANAVAQQSAAPPAVLAPPVPADIQTAPAPVPDPLVGPPLLDDLKAVPPAAKKEPDTTKPPRVPEFLGDQTPIGSLRFLPSGQIRGAGAIYVPSVRYFKISDNASPMPQTEFTISFNYVYNLFDVVNTRAGDGIQHTRIHREVFAIELADEDGTGSFGLRLPLTTYNAANTVDGLDGTGTDLGDLTVYWKYRLWKDDAGSLLSAGLAVTPTTETGSFAGTPNLKVFHNTCLQPFCGWIWRHKDLYLQGFTAVDAPTDLNDVVMLQNSVAAGYFLYQGGKGDCLTAVIPTVEVHASTPLNHRGVMAFADPAGNADQLNLTGGINFEYGDASSAGIGFVRPLIGPRMFDFQIVVQVRYRY